METQHTFFNQLVGLLTLGIYTPPSARHRAIPQRFRVVARGTSQTATEEALAQAIAQAVATKQSVYLEF